MNVGRRLRELMIEYLPDTLLHARWRDTKEGKGADIDSEVYKEFQATSSKGEVLDYYDLETLRSGLITTSEGKQLECNLWNRLDAKYPIS